MMPSRVTLVVEEEGADVEGAKEEGRIVEAVGSIVSTRDHFG